MREFKEFPCKVFEVTNMHKVRAVTVTAPAYSCGKLIGKSSRGTVRAKDCHLAWGAAMKVANQRINKRIKDLNALLVKAEQQKTELAVQDRNYKNPPAKAMKCPPKQ